MLVIPSEARNLKISQSRCSFEMTTFFCRSLYNKALKNIQEAIGLCLE